MKKNRVFLSFLIVSFLLSGSARAQAFEPYRQVRDRLREIRREAVASNAGIEYLVFAKDPKNPLVPKSSSLVTRQTRGTRLQTAALVAGKFDGEQFQRDFREIKAWMEQRIGKEKTDKIIARGEELARAVRKKAGQAAAIVRTSPGIRISAQAVKNNAKKLRAALQNLNARPGRKQLEAGTMAIKRSQEVNAVRQSKADNHIPPSYFSREKGAKGK